MCREREGAVDRHQARDRDRHREVEVREDRKRERSRDREAHRSRDEPAPKASRHRSPEEHRDSRCGPCAHRCLTCHTINHFMGRLFFYHDGGVSHGPLNSASFPEADVP